MSSWTVEAGANEIETADHLHITERVINHLPRRMPAPLHARHPRHVEGGKQIAVGHHACEASWGVGLPQAAHIEQCRDHQRCLTAVYSS